MTDYLDQLARAMAAADNNSGMQYHQMLTAALACSLTDPCATCLGYLVALQFGATMPGDESTCRDCQDEDGNPTGRVPASARLMLGEAVALSKLPTKALNGESMFFTIEVGDASLYRRISPEDTP